MASSVLGLGPGNRCRSGRGQQTSGGSTPGASIQLHMNLENLLEASRCWPRVKHLCPRKLATLTKSATLQVPYLSHQGFGSKPGPPHTT
eukprot:3232915-Amphidinium_carterae.3